MLRVVVDARVRTGGVGRYTEDLLGEYRKRGVVVRVFTSSRWRTASFTPWGRGAVARFAREEPADVFHSFHLEVPRELEVPLVVTIHDVIPLAFPASMPNRWKRRMYRTLLDRSLKAADAIVCPSDLTRDHLIEHGADPGRLHVIPNGIGSAFSPLDEAESESARRRFAGGRNYVATIANPRPHKNAKVLPDVARALDTERVPLVSLGGAAPPALTVPRLDDRDLRLFLGGADLFFLPSSIEGFGYPVLESLACGTGVVCGTDIGVLRHLRGGVEIVDVTKAPQVAELLLMLLKDDVRSEALARTGPEAARTLTAELMAARTLKLYERTGAGA